MYSLYMIDAGQDQAELEEMLNREFRFHLGLVKLVMAGAPFVSSKIGDIRCFQRRLEELGARTVVEVYSQEFDESYVSD